jgi:SAM-dependent methyltransferase
MDAAQVRERWRAALAQWEIPPQILANATASPWQLPAKQLASRSRRQLHEPSGLSYEVAAEALQPGGDVLDVGAGAGAASLALRSVAASITAVDSDDSMLATFADLATAAAVRFQCVAGTWPEVAARVAPADIVVCHHVLYNVADLAPFVLALTEHARIRVVIEITSRHPATLFNPLWEMVHGLQRPTGPTATDAIEVIATTGLTPQWRQWQRPVTPTDIDYAELVSSACQRLCVGPDRRGDVDRALRALGVGPDRPYLGDDTRQLVTIWWDVRARTADLG